ncbi:protein LEAD-SENSITIVE 1-like [Humulus lupulus]|uniref:protein LEAD-SENSITIVE 1-like n=1 Tax=Humulus lupulus TaxID=3486 RepID=UPI002B41423B|nr:protein LEAD-SENSITIVE 1-like [Humulus lupulus]
MSLISNRTNRSSLRKGDHVYSFRNLHAYSHHGIYVGDNRVIHFTRTQESESESSADNNFKIERCKHCGYEPKKNRGVVKTCLKCFLKGHRLFRFKYGVPSSNLVLNRSGTCTTGSCGYSEDEVVQRATDILKSDEGFGHFDIFENNCEAFAMYCKTGKSVSLQAFSLKNKGKIAKEVMRGQSFSMKKAIESGLNLVVKNRIDTLHYDMKIHQQDRSAVDSGDHE